MASREADVLVEHHRLDVRQKDHRDVGHGGRDAGQALLGFQTVVFLVRHVEGHLRLAQFDLGDAAGGVGHELDDRRLERRLAAPIVRIRLEPHERIALVFLDHIGAGADGTCFEAFGADLCVIGLRQDVTGQERHPFEQRRVEFLDVAGDHIVGNRKITYLRPHEIDRIAGLGVRGALQRPDDVLGAEGRPVVPGHALAHLHLDLLVVVGPAPFGDQAGRERQVRLLGDVLVEHRLINALDRRIDRRGSGGRIPGRQVDVVGDRQRSRLGVGRTVRQTAGQRGGAGGAEFQNIAS